MFKKNLNRYLIKTPTGYKNFEGVQKKTVNSLYTITFEDKTFIKCSGNHAFLSDKGFLRANELTKENTLTGKKIQNILSEFGEYEVFDPVGVEEHSTYFSNDVISHNTEFIGSTATLISAAKLKSLTYETPIESSDGFDIYEYPQKDHMYVITVDSSEGVGLDYSAFSIIDVTQIPYIQVAKYRSNQIPTLIYPTLIYSAGMRYNEAFILVETNNIGQQVVDILHHDLEYDNIFKLEHHNIKGQHISAGFKKSISFGLKTTVSVKKIGCANFKAMIESDKLILNDADTVTELYTFSRDKDTYRAEEGNHDDMAMTMVMFSWLAAQSFFKETTNSDIRRRLVEEQNLLIEESIAPVGYVDNGLQPEEVNDGKDRWSFVSDRGYPSSIL